MDLRLGGAFAPLGCPCSDVVQPRVIAIVRQFYGRMRACARLDGGNASDLFEGRQGIWQGCVLAPLVLNVLFIAALNAAEKWLVQDLDVVADLVSVGGATTTVSGKTAAADGPHDITLCSILYADDAGVVCDLQPVLRK